MVSPIYQLCAIDPSLRHGAVVHCEFRQIQHFVWQWAVTPYVLYRWQKDDKVSLSQESGPGEIYSLTRAIVMSIQKAVSPSTGIVIDWDASSGHWGARRKQIAIQAFLVGAVGANLRNAGYVLHFLAPWGVRESLGLSSRADKSAVNEALRQHCQILQTQRFNIDTDDPENDVWDSIALGYAMIMRR